MVVVVVGGVTVVGGAVGGVTVGGGIGGDPLLHVHEPPLNPLILQPILQ